MTLRTTAARCLFIYVSQFILKNQTNTALMTALTNKWHSSSSTFSSCHLTHTHTLTSDVYSQNLLLHFMYPLNTQGHMPCSTNGTQVFVCVYCVSVCSRSCEVTAPVHCSLCGFMRRGEPRSPDCERWPWPSEQKLQEWLLNRGW